MQNYVELFFFPSNLGTIKVVIIIKDNNNDQISIEKQEIKKRETRSLKMGFGNIN